MDNAKHIASKFCICGDIQGISPLKVGHINDSYIVDTDGGKYLLQRLNTSIFTNVDGLQRNIKTVTDHIREHLIKIGEDDIDRKVMTVIPCADDRLYFIDDTGNSWRMYTFIKDSHSVDEVTPFTAYLAGNAFGRFQAMLSDIPESEITESIPHFHDLRLRVDQFRQALAEDKAARANLPESKSIINELEQRIERMLDLLKPYDEGSVPKRISHCDTKVNNMLLDDNDKPIAIVDLDTVMPSVIYSDFGDFVRTAVNTGAEDEIDLNKVGVNEDVYNAFLKGYLETATFLTPLEKELLHFGPLYMTYMQALRFFTDYLNGDTYYKVDYPEHNLQRTRAQLKYLQTLEDFLK